MAEKKKTGTREWAEVSKNLFIGCKQIFQPALHVLTAMKKAGTKFQIPGQGKLTYKNLIGSGIVMISTLLPAISH